VPINTGEDVSAACGKGENVKVFGPDFPVGLPDSFSDIATGDNSGRSTGAGAPPRSGAPAPATDAAALRAVIDDSLQLLPEPRVGEKIPASALPPEAQVLFTEAQMAMGSFARTRLFLEQVITANPADAQFSAPAMESILSPDANTAAGRAVQQLLQNGANLGAASGQGGGPQMLIIARDAMTGALYRLQTPLAGAEVFRPAPGDLLTLYWAGLSMQGPLRGLYLRHERSGDGLLLADLGSLARSWQSRLKALLQAGVLFLLIIGALVGLAVLAGMSSDLSETLVVSALILGALGYLLFLSLR